MWKISSKDSGSTGNVMTPLTWGSLVIELTFGFALKFSTDPIMKYIALAFSIGWAIFYARQYLYWRDNDPKKLLSESYNLANDALLLGNQNAQNVPKPVMNEFEPHKFIGSSEDTTQSNL